MLNGIIGIVKATLAIALLTLLLGACATPYYPVYTNDSGDYYVAEKGSSGAYYGSGSSSLYHIGMYPWWEFSYYSPYFYPHYFSVWHPPRYYYWYGTYGWYGYHPTRYRSPYRSPAHRVPVAADQPMPAYPVITSPPPSGSYAPTDLATQVPGRRIDADRHFRDTMYRGQPNRYDRSTNTPGTSRSYTGTSRSEFPRSSSMPSHSGSYSSRSVGPSSARTSSRSIVTKTGSTRLPHTD